MESRALGHQPIENQSDDTPSAAVQVLWENLLLEIYFHIFSYLSPEDVLSFLLVSKTLRSYANSYYRSLVRSIFPQQLSAADNQLSLLTAARSSTNSQQQDQHATNRRTRPTPKRPQNHPTAKQSRNQRTTTTITTTAATATAGEVVDQQNNWRDAVLPAHIPNWYVAYKMVAPTADQIVNLARRMAFLVDMDDLAEFKALYGERVAQHLVHKQEKNFTCFPKPASSVGTHFVPRDDEGFFNEVFYRAAVLNRRSFLDYFYALLRYGDGRRRRPGSDGPHNAFIKLLASIMFRQSKKEIITNLKSYGSNTDVIMKYRTPLILQQYMERMLTVAILANNLMVIPLLIRFQGWQTSIKVGHVSQEQAMRDFELINFAENPVILAQAGIRQFLELKGSYHDALYYYDDPYHLSFIRDVLPPLRKQYFIPDNYRCVHCNTAESSIECLCYSRGINHNIGLYSLAVYAGTCEMVKLLDEIFIIKQIEKLDWDQICKLAIRSGHYDALLYLLPYAQEKCPYIDSLFIITEVLEKPPHLIQYGLSVCQQHIVPAIELSKRNATDFLIWKLLSALSRFSCHEILEKEIQQALKGRFFDDQLLKFCVATIKLSLDAEAKGILRYKPELVVDALQVAVTHEDILALENLVTFIYHEKKLHAYLNYQFIFSLFCDAISVGKIAKAALIAKLHHTLIADALLVVCFNDTTEILEKVLAVASGITDSNIRSSIEDQIKTILWLALSNFRYDIVESIFICSPNYHRLALEIIIASKNDDMLVRHQDKITNDSYGYLLGKASEVDNVFAVNLMREKFSLRANSDAALRQENSDTVLAQAHNNNRLSYHGFAGITFGPSVQGDNATFSSLAQNDADNSHHVDKRQRLG